MSATDPATWLRERADSYARDARKFRDAGRLAQPILSAADDAHWAEVYQAIATELRHAAGHVSHMADAACITCRA